MFIKAVLQPNFERIGPAGIMISSISVYHIGRYNSIITLINGGKAKKIKALDRLEDLT